MTDIDDDWDDYDAYEDYPPGWDTPEPDHEREWLEELEDHCDRVHGGRACTCRPSLRERLARWRYWRFRSRLRSLLRRDRYDDQPPF